MKRRLTAGDIIFDTINVLALSFMAILCLYPIYYCVVASISDPNALAAAGGFMLWPKGVQFGAYKSVFANKEIFTGYMNTFFYVIAGTVLNLLLTLMGAYVLSRSKLRLKRFLNLYVTLTMFINGGMIPLYLVMKGIGLLDLRAGIILVTAVNTYNLIMARTYFSTIPASLEEAARVDGAGEIRILFEIMIPLSGPIIAVLALYYAVIHWNSWFNEMIYLSDRAKYPIQLFLREILILNEVSSASQDFAADKMPLAESIKYATIVVATVPILCVYPFVQRFFVKGVMVGAVKG
jgi:putative aldouronate transport system permease protein